MTKTTVLGSIYLLLLFAFAVGVESLARGDCSDWVMSCPGEKQAMVRPKDQPALPGDSEER
ncbi:MAG: hypothetical protein QNJ00_02940 [Woeseiaceae bacterium]|nr:hypothetical protein [Woeseiaceae bacterium]